MGRKREPRGNGSPRPLGAMAIRSMAHAVGEPLDRYIDRERGARKKWEKIAQSLEAAGRGRFQVSGAQVRELAVRFGINLVPGPRRRGTGDVGVGRPVARRALADLPEPSSVRRSAVFDGGSIEHAMSALRDRVRARNGQPHSTHVIRVRVRKYIDSLGDDDRAALLEELLLQKVRPRQLPAPQHSSTSSSVRTVPGGLPSMGKRS